MGWNGRRAITHRKLKLFNRWLKLGNNKGIFSNLNDWQQEKIGK